jgi:hypothetical protein
VNDAEYAAQKERIQTVLDKWTRQLGLRWWDIEYEFHREGLQPDDHREVDSDSVCLAKTVVQWQYATATIKLNVQALADIDDASLDKTILHECQHIFLHEMRWFDESDGIFHEERVATNLTKAFLWMRDCLNKEHEAMSKVDCG